MKTVLLFAFASLLVTDGRSFAREKPQDEMLLRVVEVIAANGKAVSGAEVYVCCPPSRNRILEQPIIAQGRTDEQGKFNVSYRMPAHWSTFYADVLAVSDTAGVGVGAIYNSEGSDPPKSLTITLQPPAEFKARLLRPDGSPAAGLEVWVGSYGLSRSEGSTPPFPVFGDMPRLPDRRWKAKTDADGRCVIPNVPRNAAIHLEHGDRRYAQLYGKHNILLPTSPRADGTENTLQLTHPGSIRGRVVLPDGSGVGGTIVSIIERTDYVTAYGGAVRAGADGRFVIEQIPASSYNLHYETDPPFFDDWIGTDKKGVVVEVGKATDIGDLRVSKVAVVTAEVVNAVTGAKVENPLQFRLTAGLQTLRYRSQPYPPEGYLPPVRGDDLSVTLQDGERKTVQFKLRPVKAEDLVTGVVQDAEGKPAPGVDVTLASWNHPVPAKTGPDGTFKLVCPPDSKGLAVVAWDANKAMSDPLSVKPGESVTLKLLRDGFAKVTGHVSDEAGRPVEHANVRCSIPRVEFGFHGGPVPLSVLTDADGRFTFPRLWTSTADVTFFCSMKGYGSDSKRDVKLSADKPMELQFTLKKPKPGGVVSGVLVNSAGRPVPGVDVTYSGDGQPQDRHRFTTDAQGRFVIAPLIAGRVNVHVYEKTDSFTRRIDEWVTVPKTGLRLVLPDADGTLTGTVVDSLGKPVADARVNAIERGRETQTDTQGRFALTGIVKGWFGLEVSFKNAAGEEVTREQRLKAGTRDLRIQMPPKTKRRHALLLAPVDLVGRPAADLQIATWINTEPLVGKARGKVRILDFWGIQCAPCIAGMPKVRDFWQKHRNENLEIIALTTYPAGEVSDFLAKHTDYTFPFAIEAEDSTTGDDYDLRGIPLYVVIDTGGRIVSSGHEWAEASAVALKLLGEK